jgi:GT2 family glycosyltransferase
MNQAHNQVLSGAQPTVVSDGSAANEVTVSIIIANYNARDLLADCLDSIFRQPSRHALEVLVIDDYSSDDSFQMVKLRFPQVRAYKNDANLHYATSNNRMFDIARGRYLFLLNNDTLVQPEAVDLLVDFMEAHPGVGCAGSKLLNEDGSIQESVKTLPNLRSAFFGARSYAYRWFPGNRFSKYELLNIGKEVNEPLEAGYVSSAAMVIRREIVVGIGYLDPRLSYHVDADYCARIWKAGWSVVYVPESVVIHLNHRGGTLVSPRRRLKSVIEFHRGTWIYFERHMMQSYWHPVTWLIAAGIGARFVGSLLIQQTDELRRRLLSSVLPT